MCHESMAHPLFFRSADFIDFLPFYFFTLLPLKVPQISQITQIKDFRICKELRAKDTL